MINIIAELSGVRMSHAYLDMEEPQAGPICVDLCREWQSVLHLGIKKEYPAGGIILKAGDPIDELCFLRHGEVLVNHYTSVEIDSPVFIARKNSFLGLVGFFTQASTLIAWETLTPCTIYHYSRKTIYENIEPRLLLKLLEQLAWIAKNFNSRLYLDHSHQNEKRLARLLLHLSYTCPAREEGGVLHVTPGLTQNILSRLLGLHPVSLNRLLSSFRAEGIIGRFTKKHLEIFKVEKLREYASAV